MTNPENRLPILPLTSARFFAAWYVVLVHGVLWTNHVDTSTWIGRFSRNGAVAVGFFFVLSGYILAHVYLNTDRPFSARKFWTSRIARIYPLLLLSLLIDVPRYWWEKVAHYGPGHGGKAILHVLMMLLSEAALLQAWSAHFRGLNAPSWSLSAEAFFYLVFPFAAFNIWRSTRKQAVFWIASCWAGTMFFPLIVTWLRPALFVQVETSQLQWAIMLMPVFRVFEFFAGVALCSFQRDFAEKFTPQERRRYGYAMISSGLGLFVVVIELSNYIPVMAMNNGILLPVFTLVILGLVNIRGWLALLLSSKWLVILGESSYAVYLLHSPVWDYFSRLYPVTKISVWLLYCAIVQVVSLAAFFMVERPSRRWILNVAGIKPAIIQEEEQVARLFPA